MEKVTKTKKTPEKKRRKHTFSARRDAFHMYLDDVPVKEISVRTGIPVATLHTWVDKKRWKDKRNELQESVFRTILDQYQGVVERNQLKTLQRKLRIAALLDRNIMNELIDDNGNLKSLSAARLKDLTVAFRQNAGVDAKLLGLFKSDSKTAVIAGSGSIVNIGVRPQPTRPPVLEKQIEAAVSVAPYDRPLIGGSAPF